MKRVRIVGGGLSGTLAAFQAHRMGARNIEIFERLDQLGGIALPALKDGIELREGCVYFGPKGDPIRTLLEDHNARFEDFDNSFGSVSPGTDGPIYLEDFGGPQMPATSLDLQPQSGESLSDRLSCYQDELAFPLARYVRWHVGCNPSQLHASAAEPLAINRVYPSGPSLDALAQAKKTDNLSNELFGIPRSLWGYSANSQASLPVGGLSALFERCRTALYAIGVRIHDRAFARPKAMLEEHCEDDVLVWAASPMPLFKTVDLEPPKAPAKKFATYIFKADWDGALPFYVQNFTARGSCFRVYIYQSQGQTLLTAECVSEASNADLAEDIQDMLDGFKGNLTLGELLFHTVKPRWLYHSVDTIARLGTLRSTLADRMGNGFVASGWEAYSKGEKFAEVERNLQLALGANRVAQAS